MERRKYLRVRVDLPTHVTGEDVTDVEGRCYSIGGGGFGFQLPRAFEVGEWLTVEIELGEERINARAVVVGCTPAGEPGVWNLGTRLEELPDEDRRRLLEVLPSGPPAA